ncbi:hypothetical protein GCM10010381_09660 [Streptomyces xantholiticus]|nr:hypothetical protein GCM10010381_09660 [Streptomyces xantholiticus]
MGGLGCLTEKQLDGYQAGNLKGTYLTTQAVVRRMREQGRGGSIVNIGTALDKRDRRLPRVGSGHHQGRCAHAPHEPGPPSSRRTGSASSASSEKSDRCASG